MTTANVSSSCALLVAYAYQVPFHLDLLDPRLPGCTPGPKIGPNSITLLLGGANSMLSRGTGACTLWHRYADCYTYHALVRCTLPPENTWAELRGSMTEAASEVFGLCRRKQTDWFLVSSATLLPALADKCAALLSVLQDRNDSTITKARNEVKRLPRQAYEQYRQDLSEKVERCASTGDIRGMYSGINEALGPTVKKTAPLRATDGTIVKDLPGQLGRWVEHYSLLYGTPVHANLNAVSAVIPQLPVFNELDAEISTMEIEPAIAAMKNNKSPGSDGIPAELLKCGGTVLVRRLHCLFRSCWQNKCIPSELKNANIITLYKNKGDKQDCNNYRGISLLSLSGKSLARAILSRLQCVPDQVLPESQCSFRAGRSTLHRVRTHHKPQ